MSTIVINAQTVALIAIAPGALSALIAYMALRKSRQQLEVARQSAAQQLEIATRGATLNAILPFYEKYHSPKMREIRRAVYRAGDGGVDPDRIKARPGWKDDIEELLNDLEFLGSLVSNELISFAVVESVFHTSVPRLYPRLRPYIIEQRESDKGRATYAKNYEALCNRYPSEKP